MSRVVAFVSSTGLLAGLLALSAAPAPAQTQSAPEKATTSSELTAKKHKSKLVLQTSATAAVKGEKIRLGALFQPETVRKVKFKKRLSGKKHKGDWSTVKNKTLTTNGFGYAEINWKPKKPNTYLVKAFAPKNKKFVKQSSKDQKIIVGTKNQGIKATFPKKAYVDVPFKVPVSLKPKKKTTIHVQRFDDVSKTWRNEGTPGTKTKTNAKGKATITMQDGIAENVAYRVVSSNGLFSPVSFVNVDGDWLQAFYQPPANFPQTPGKLIRTMPMTGTVPTPPNPAIPTASLPAGVDQYRYLYTTMRHDPKTATEKPDVASGMVFMPDPSTPAPKGYSKSNRPVIVWAHPTLGTAFPCAPSTGAEGYKVNYLDLSWWMSAGGNYINTGKGAPILPRPGGVLANGYVVVVPDYLSVATPGKETYLIGQQEANDIIYAAKAIQEPANKNIAWTQGKAPQSTWPGADASNDFAVPGHSQGGHAALWVGANKALATQQGLTLKGTAPVAPASDLMTSFTQNYDQQAGWVIGPYAAKTFVDNFGDSFLDFLTPEGKANYETMANMCTTEAFIYTLNNFVKNGQLTANFSKKPDMSDPTFANTWGVQLNAQTPLVGGMQSQSPLAPAHPGYDNSVPALLIQGQADDIVLSQTAAALQDQMCSAGVPLATYWPTVNPMPIPGVLDLQANHLNVMTWPVPDNLLGLFSDAADSVTTSSTLAEWLDGVFQGQKPVTCNQKEWTMTENDAGETIISSIHTMLPQAACPVIQDGYNCSSPALSDMADEDNPNALFMFTDAPTQAGPAFGANTQLNGVPQFTIEFAPGFKTPGLYAYAASNQSGLYPFSSSVNSATWARTANPKNANGFIYDNAGPGSPTPWGVYPFNGQFYK